MKVPGRSGRGTRRCGEICSRRDVEIDRGEERVVRGLAAKIGNVHVRLMRSPH